MAYKAGGDCIRGGNSGKENYIFIGELAFLGVTPGDKGLSALEETAFFRWDAAAGRHPRPLGFLPSVARFCSQYHFSPKMLHIPSCAHVCLQAQACQESRLRC